MWADPTAAPLAGTPSAQPVTRSVQVTPLQPLGTIPAIVLINPVWALTSRMMKLAVSTMYTFPTESTAIANGPFSVAPCFTALPSKVGLAGTPSPK